MYSRLTHWVNPVLIVSYNGVRLFDAKLLPKPTLTSYQIGRLGANFRIFRYKIFSFHDDVIKWKHFPRYWPFVRGIHRSPVNSPHEGQWRGALMFTLICARINGWVNNREAGDLRRYRSHYDVIVMQRYMFKEIAAHHYVCLWVNFSSIKPSSIGT